MWENMTLQKGKYKFYDKLEIYPGDLSEILLVNLYRVILGLS